MASEQKKSHLVSVGSCCGKLGLVEEGGYRTAVYFGINPGRNGSRRQIANTTSHPCYNNHPGHGKSSVNTSINFAKPVLELLVSCHYNKSLVNLVMQSQWLGIRLYYINPLSYIYLLRAWSESCCPPVAMESCQSILWCLLVFCSVVGWRGGCVVLWRIVTAL